MWGAVTLELCLFINSTSPTIFANIFPSWFSACAVDQPCDDQQGISSATVFLSENYCDLQKQPLDSKILQKRSSRNENLEMFELSYKTTEVIKPSNYLTWIMMSTPRRVSVHTDF